MSGFPTEKQLYACRLIYEKLNKGNAEGCDEFLSHLTFNSARQYISDHKAVYAWAKGTTKPSRNTSRGSSRYYPDAEDCYDMCIYSAWYG